MTVRNLSALMEPKSVALIGASSRSGTLGAAVMRNLLRGEFQGPVLPVNPKYRSVMGVLCYPNLERLPIVPDLALICTPPPTVAPVIQQLGQLGTRAVVVMTVDPDPHADHRPTAWRRAVLEAARPFGMRILGPGSAGIQHPRIGLNASWLVTPTKPGRIAFISHSVSFLGGVAEWATANGVGFSHLLSLGDAADADLGDLLDHLASDMWATAVALYVGSVGDGRKFLSATRTIARIKPVVAVRPGWPKEENSLVLPSGEVLDVPDSDEVVDAAFRRAGILRVDTIGDIFDAVETLATTRKLLGDRLAVLCNGLGPGALAADAFRDGEGRIATLSEATVARLRKAHARCHYDDAVVDLGREADPARYREAVTAVLADHGVDALLVMHSTTPLAPANECAREVTAAATNTVRNVLACWLGDNLSDAARTSFQDARIPLFPTPEKATRAFIHLIRYRRNQQMLVQAPASVPVADEAARESARQRVITTIESGRRWLDEAEAVELLGVYGIPPLPARVVNTPEEAMEAAIAVGLPTGLRFSLVAPYQRLARDDIVTGLITPEAVWSAAGRLLHDFATRNPERPAPRLVVQHAPELAHAFAFTMGIATDPDFGRVIYLRSTNGRHVVALPPLNMVLAEELLTRAGITNTMASSLAMQTLNREAILAAVVRLSELAVDLPEIAALVIDPLLVDDTGARVLDARIVLEMVRGQERSLFAIRPYPRELREQVALKDGRALLLRPVRPEDEPAYRTMLRHVALDELYMRYCQHFSNVEEAVVAAMQANPVHIDYDRQMTIIGVMVSGERRGEIVGSVEITATPDNTEAEYSVLVRSDFRGTGLGRLLMQKIVQTCRDRGIGTVYGLVLPHNRPMLSLVTSLGFRIRRDGDLDDMVRAVLDLTPPETHTAAPALPARESCTPF